MGRSICRGKRIRHGCQLPWSTLPVVRNSLDEQVGADVEECCQLFGLRFANGALAVEYLGRNSFRSEDFPEVLLHQIASLHRSEEHTSELQSRLHLVCRLLLEKK